MKMVQTHELYFISIVLLADEIMSVDDVQRLQRDIAGRYLDYEILIVDQPGRNLIKAQMTSLMETVSCLRYLELSYSVDQETALSAGVENAIGDFVFIFNASRDPKEVISQMISRTEQSPMADVVVGVATNLKKSWGYRLIRPLASTLLQSIEYGLPKNATTLRCLSRTAVNAATRTGHSQHQIFSRIANCGLETAEFNYEVFHPEKLNRSLTQAISTTFKILIFNSTKPLRWVSFLGLFGALFSLLFATYSFFAKLMSNHIAEGWSSTVMLVSFLFMILFFMLSIFGEYLVRILNNGGQTSAYWINKESYSSQQSSAQRPNVVETSFRKEKKNL